MKRLLFVLFTISLFSCGNSIDMKEIYRYEVISVLYDRLAKPIEPIFPPPPPDSLNYVFSSKDSLRRDSIIKKINRERNERKQIVAINPQLNPYLRGSQVRKKNCFRYDETMNKLMTLKDSLKIDIDKIITKRNDSIIYFKNELLDEYSRGFYKFDILISFSRIAFNKDYTKAVVVGSLSHSTIAGASILYFLEKTNDIWKIKCTKDLSIS